MMGVLSNCYSGIADIRRELVAGTTSIPAIVDDTIGRIDRLDPLLKAFVLVSSGEIKPRAPKTNARPLEGVTLAIKDLFDYARLPTRAGSSVTPSQLASTTAPSVVRLEQAGAVVIGKTQTVEFAFGGWGTNTVQGTPRNPWDLTEHRVPGGSSSGSAVAVSAGMATVALGTDTGGSVRTPASFCGLVGVKTSSGAVPRQGIFPLSPSLDSVGTLSRSVRDAAEVLQVLCDPQDHEANPHGNFDFLGELDNGVEGYRIAVFDDLALSETRGDILGLYHSALLNLEATGARISTFQMPASFMEYLEQAGKIMSAESFASQGHLVEREDSKVAPEIRARVIAGRNMSPQVYHQLLSKRRSSQLLFAKHFEAFDALICPTCPGTAIRVSEVDENKIVTPYGRFINYLDLAAVSVPMGLGLDGLPAGLQIAVKNMDDARALRIAQIVETQIGRLEPPII